MPMIHLVAYFVTMVLAMSRGAVPSLSPADKFTAPAHVDDVAFAGGDQIVALSSETSNPTNGERRCFLSVWNIEQKKWLLTKPMDALPPSISCGSVGYLPLSRRLVINRAGIAVFMDPDTLTVVRTISVEPYNFLEVSEQDDTVYALSKPGHNPVTLVTYHLNSGSLAQQTEFPDLDHSLGTSTAATILSPGRVLFVQSEIEPLTLSGRSSNLALCVQDEQAKCKIIHSGITIANARPTDGSLLLVSGDFADHSTASRNQCIERLSLSTFQVDPQGYCRPAAGVHYSIDTLGNDFVLGYSGYGARWGWLDDGLIVNKSSSISVWNARSGRLVATASLSHGRSFTLTSSVIRADTSGKKRFLFYNPMEGSEILLYDLNSLE